MPFLCMRTRCPVDLMPSSDPMTITPQDVSDMSIRHGQTYSASVDVQQKSTRG